MYDWYLLITDAFGLKTCNDVFIADAAAACDLFLFLSGGNVNTSDGRVIVEPPSDSLDAIAAPRHCVALDYLYGYLSYSRSFSSHELQISHEPFFCSIQCIFQPVSPEGRAF